LGGGFSIMRSILSGQSRNKGVTLITLVIAITIFGVLVSVFSYLMIAKHGSEALYVQSTQAYAIAQAGIEYSIRYSVDNGYGNFPITRSLVNGSFTVTYTEGDPSELTSTGTVGTAERTIIYVFQKIMYVADITMSGKVSGPWRTGYATVTVNDINGAPVEGVTVSGHWSGAASNTDADVTDDTGQTRLESDKVRNPIPPLFTFTVDDLSRPDYSYDPTLNVETSDSITL
jgi:hypothetical protein